MPGDYSRNSFKPRRHYSAVLMQQGRVQLDADWNEQLAIEAWRRRATTADLIGRSGTSKSGDGFRIACDSGGRKLTIGAGRYHVEGLLCELDPGSPVLDYTAQPDHPRAEYSRPHVHGRVLDLKAGCYLAYLVAREIEVSALSDPSIAETALGGADTAIRSRVLWQVRLASVRPPSAGGAIPEWGALSAPSSASLKVKLADTGAASRCPLAASPAYTAPENQLYRVEIQRGGGLGVSTFKWSRDNATVETKITANRGAQLFVTDLGRDEVLGFAPGQWVEIVDHEAEVERTPNPLFRIEDIDLTERSITLDAPGLTLTGRSDLRLRRWDQSADAASGGIPTSSEWIALENGIAISFGEGIAHPGDFWQIPARALSGQLEWPPEPGIKDTPQGPELRFAQLALIQAGADGRISRIEDRRVRFPALSTIAADDVSYCPPATSGLAATVSVEDALDALLMRAACSLVLAPGEDLQARIDALPIGADAAICFRPGTYALAAPLLFAHRGRLQIRGTGARLVAAASESALSFVHCAAVSISELHAESGMLARGNRILGALDFEDCGEVELARISAQCAGGAQRAAACLSLRQSAKPDRSRLALPRVRICDCELAVGHRQIGLLCVDAINTLIERNRIHAAPRQGAALSLAELAKDSSYRQRVLSGLIANATLGDLRVAANGATNCTIRSGGQAVQFRTHPDLKKAWAELVIARPPTGIRRAQDLLAWMREQAVKMITAPALRSGAFSAWFDAVSRENAPLLFQGVVVGGEVAEEVRVRDNTIEDALQGIHVGVSHRVSASEAAATRVDVAGTVQISGNTIEIAQPMETSGDERHGIFVGNCASLSVETNRIKFLRVANAAKTAIDGIRIYGHLGPRVVIERNHLTDFPTGIRFTPRFPYPPRASVLWIIAENFAPGAANSHTVVAPQNANVELRLNRPE